MACDIDYGDLGIKAAEIFIKSKKFDDLSDDLVRKTVDNLIYDASHEAYAEFRRNSGIKITDEDLEIEFSMAFVHELAHTLVNIVSKKMKEY